MKTIKVSEATELQLNWLVAKCESLLDKWGVCAPAGFKPSTDWACGGPLIAREQISVDFDADPECGGPCAASTRDSYRYWVGPTPLIAAMRCFCSKLGDEVEVPDELL